MSIELRADMPDERSSRPSTTYRRITDICRMGTPTVYDSEMDRAVTSILSHWLTAVGIQGNTCAHQGELSVLIAG